MRFKFARVRVTGVDCKQQYRGCCSSGNLSILDAPVLSAMTDGNSCLASDNSGQWVPVLKVSVLERVDCGHLTINPEAEGALI